jgi:peptidyl-prolyl cis-trans isomerase SurA
VLNKLCILLLCALFVAPAFAQESGVIAVVNDQPVTSFDIDQRINLLKVLNPGFNGGADRKKIANDLINDVVKISEAKRARIEPTEKDVDDRLKGVAKGMKTDTAGLEDRLKKRGVTMVAFRQYIASQMAFGRLLQVKFKDKVEADPGAVDKKLASIKSEINGKVAKIMADPRMQPITVYSIMEVNFPASGNDPQLLQSRAIEANQYLGKFKGCGSAQSAASGIFNVKVGRKVEADGRKLPPQLKNLFNSKGPGHAYGPMRTKDGIQVVAFCGTRQIVPPKPKVQIPTRDQIQNVVLNEKYDQVEQKYVRIMRQGAIIEYKDQAYVQ